MGGEDRGQPRTITVLPDQSQIDTLTRQMGLSDIQIYKDILAQEFTLAKTAEEYEKLIGLRQKIQGLDLESRRLDYAEKSAQIQLQESKQKAVFQRGQQIVSGAVSVGLGIYFMQSLPLAGLLFLILGLAKPLGYSLGEISDLLDGLKGFPNDSDNLLSNRKDQDSQSEEVKDARF